MPRTRLLWDENLSTLVPRALQVLGFRVTYVGDGARGAPPRGAPDEVVVEHAKSRRQLIVTQNHDMMTLCNEQGQRFVWIDPRGRQLTREQQVLLVFTQIRQWDRILAPATTACVRAMRTKCVQIAPDEAARLARNRMRSLSAKTRRRAVRSTPVGGLLEGERT